MDRQPTDRRDDDAVQKPAVWLDQIAEAEGVSREEAVEFLVSSYWQLQEVADVLEEAETPQEAADETAADPSGAEFDWNADEITETPDVSGSGTADLHRLLGAVDEVFDRLEALEAAVDEVAEANERGGPATSASIDRLDDRLREVEDYLEAVVKAIDTLDARTATIREETASTARVEELADRMTAVQDASTTRHDDLRDRIAAEFTNIRTILEHLIEAREADDDRSAQRIDAIQDRLKALQRDRERVATISRVANREGLREADCGHCGRTLDLGLLETAQCPNCEHAFTDLRASDGLLGLFRSATLVVD